MATWVVRALRVIIGIALIGSVVVQFGLIVLLWVDGEIEPGEHGAPCEALADVAELDGGCHDHPLCICQKLFMTLTHCLLRIQDLD